MISPIFTPAIRTGALVERPLMSVKLALRLYDVLDWLKFSVVVCTVTKEAQKTQEGRTVRPKILNLYLLALPQPHEHGR